MNARSNLVPGPDDAMIDLGWALIAPLGIPSYQRDAFEHRVQKLLPFLLRACGVLELSYRSGTLWIVDGQARRAAALRCGFDRLPARISYDLDEEEEAILYLYHNRDRIAIKPLDRHKAEAISNDPRAIAIDEVLHSNNLIAASKSENGLRIFRSIGKAEKVYEEGGGALLDRVVKLLERGLPGDTGRFRGTLVGGLGYFLARDPWGASDEKILSALKRSNSNKLDEMMHHAQQLAGKPTGGAPVYMARAIASAVYRSKAFEWKPSRTPLTERPKHDDDDDPTGVPAA